jgi:HEAT repeat protein
LLDESWFTLKAMMPKRQSAGFRRKLTLLVKETPARHRAEVRRAIEVLVTSRIHSLEELVGVVELETSERNLRELACWAVGRLRPRGWTATLGRVMATAPDAGLAHTAVERLVATKSSTAVKVLRQVLVRGRSPAGRAEAAWGLGVLYARSAAGSLIRVVLRQAEDRSVRAEAAEALGYIRDRRAVRPLLKVLEDPDPRIRYEAIFALGVLGDRRALPALGQLLGDTTEVARLGQIGTAAADARQAIEMVNPARTRKAGSRPNTPRRRDRD